MSYSVSKRKDIDRALGICVSTQSNCFVPLLFSHKYVFRLWSRTKYYWRQDKSQKGASQNAMCFMIQHGGPALIAPLHRFKKKKEINRVCARRSQTKTAFWCCCLSLTRAWWMWRLSCRTSAVCIADTWQNDGLQEEKFIRLPNKSIVLSLPANRGFAMTDRTPTLPSYWSGIL